MKLIDAIAAYTKARAGETSTARSAARLVSLIGGAFGASVSPEMALIIAGIGFAIAEFLGIALPDNWADVFGEKEQE